MTITRMTINGVLSIAMAIAMTSVVHAQAPTAIDARVDALLKQMTIEEKVGEMTQLTIDAVTHGPARAGMPMPLDSVKLENALVKRHVGALLNTSGAMTPQQWQEVQAMIQRFARRKRLKIPVIYGIDAVHGQHYMTTATIFPQNIAMAATWNPELMRRSAQITAYETRATGIQWNFAPVLDLGRQPLWPRFYETFGEDPYLASVLGVEAVRGNQEDPRQALASLLAPARASARAKNAPPPVGGSIFVAATGKHYLGYSMPLSGKDRTTAWIPDRELREYYLPTFQRAIEANLRTVMVNSGDINGVPVHASHEILTDLLRTELGFTGIADTDWEDIIKLYRVHHVAANNKDAVRMAVMAGIDMSMVPYDYSFTDDLLACVRDGSVPQARIDEAVRRILRVKFELGMFENPDPDPAMIANIGAAGFQPTSRMAAEEAITLLKNSGGLLPLAKTSRVLVTGPTAAYLPSQYGGWSYTWQGSDTTLYPKGVHTLLDAVRAQVGAANVTYVPGTTLDAEGDIAAAVAAARNADVAIVALGEGSYAETPGDIDDLTLPAAQLRLARAIEATGKPVVIALFQGRPRIVREAVDSARAVITGYETGPYGGDAMAGVLFGTVNPSGKLPFSWPRSTGALLVPYDRAGPSDSRGNDSSRAGYRPEWPFGHGLSYTTFAYSDLNVASASAGVNDTATISVTVANTGARAGKEVVQLNVRDLVASVNPPVKRLRGFQKVSLNAGEKRTVTFKLPIQRLAFVGRDNKWVVEPGDFDIMVGGQTARMTVR